MLIDTNNEIIWGAIVHGTLSEKSIPEEEQNSSNGLNGFILLTHIGTSPERIDKFHETLEELIR